MRSAHSEVADLSYNAGQWQEEKRRPLGTIVFNEHGYIIEELLYDLHGSLAQVGTKKYDAYGNKAKVLFQNSRGGLLSSLVCQCDETGKLLESVSTQAHGSVTKQRCRPLYDVTGRKVEETWFYEDGTLSRKYVYRYRLTGELVQQLRYKYAVDGAVDEKWSSIYDEKGNVIETVCFDAQGRTIAGPTWYKYNDDGDEIEASTCGLSGELYSITRYSYDFDAQRNWIKRLEIFKTTNSGFETRVITYRKLEYY
ncbi:MAG TPA: hypothetical protein VHH35_15545 [Pyrinomonadaceae bacterium]|nr:hypothetical protein [Pyrinomonadaceae bacterium]